VRLVLDWDGTVALPDTLSLVMERFGDFALWRATGGEMGSTLTHDEAIARSFATVRAPLGAVVDALLRDVRPRAGFRELALRHRPLVLSSGFRELIEPLLEAWGLAGGAVELRANRIDARPDGWRIRFRDTGACRHCGEPCKRSALPARPLVYVGDGYSDRCAALAATRVFATGSLALYLAERGVRYDAFDDFYDVLARLDAEEAASPARDER
jgi:2-hydroxy-3-keto-5-methylthiopentenyl-1-phosphate phosphatase